MTRCLLIFVLIISPGVFGREFSEYLADVRLAAIESGISAGTVDVEFANLELDERVIGFDRRQPEFVQTFEDYLTARVSDFRKREARRLFRENAVLLTEIEREYQVDAAYIVAFWGLETSFGRYQGKYPIIRSLATLGYDQRRSAFFTKELIHALKILDEKHVSPAQFLGAWAGAMGQAQFMPSSFLNYAVDHDGDGRKDIWHSEADVFASIANYLRQSGWRLGHGWGKATGKVSGDWSELVEPEPDPRCRALRYHTKKFAPEYWAHFGFDVVGLKPEVDYSLVLPEPMDKKSYLAGGNFRAILSYNCANKYAISVGLLADHILKD